MSTTRQFEGKAPRDAVHAAVHAAVIWNGNEVWHLWVRKLNETGSWLSLKLCAVGRVPSKANYWFGWSLRDRRLSTVADVGALAKGRPALYEALIRALNELCDDTNDPRIMGRHVACPPYEYTVAPATPTDPHEPLKGLMGVANPTPSPIPEAATPTAPHDPLILRRGRGDGVAVGVEPSAFDESENFNDDSGEDLI